MKKYITIMAALILLYIAWDYTHYQLGWYIDLHLDKAVETFIKTKDTQIYMNSDGDDYIPFEIKGVNLGSGMPGQWATDFKIDKETYIRWFGYIQEMGANTIRVYTIQQDVFYNAFYEYNQGREKPLYLLHGVWVNDYVQHSHLDAFDPTFYGTFIEDCRTAVDVIHGERKLSLGRVASAGSGRYNRDISQWVIGYILGVEWEDVTVAYTDSLYAEREDYDSHQGKYMYTTDEASPFEVMLARVGDKIIEYESNRYKQQRLVAFSNWPTTDPFTYEDKVADFFMKCAEVDVEHIRTTDAFISGHFASYHIYPYYPDYLSYVSDWSEYFDIPKESFMDSDGRLNTYRAYLKMITDHHTIPVVISEYGVSTGRGMAQRDMNTGRNQGNMSERGQGEAILACYEDIMSTGCAGSCIFTWQDEWFKRTWNTMYAVDLKRTPYWSDYQTNEQYFGLLSFGPGKEESVCYVDGDLSEWSDDDIVAEAEGMSVSAKYNEKFIYFRIHKDSLDLTNDTLWIPIDTTQKSGSSYCSEYNLRFDKAADFLIMINGTDNSRVLVQERYEALRSTYSQITRSYDTYVEGNLPDIDSPRFVSINMILQTATFLLSNGESGISEVYETGLLIYGDANPAHPDFNSLADFFCIGDDIELKIPWQLLNFSDPSRMQIHDDYYDGNYGVDYISIDKINVGIGCNKQTQRISLSAFELNGWKNKVTWHERLKSSYYVLKDAWGDPQ